MVCEQCPRRCGVDREKEQGFCRVGEGFRIARAALHRGEEPCISGPRGAGAIFFSGCNLGCLFCQNRRIAHTGAGQEVSPERLEEIFRELQEQGASNLDLVTPTPYTEQLLPLLARAPLPVVWNSSAYERPDELRKLEGLVDVYLPDFKFSDPELAGRLCRATDYPQVALEAILEMARQVGPPVMENGVLKRGLLIRHLILPGEVENSLGVLRLLTDALPPDFYLFSLMSQYTPPGGLPAMPGHLVRPISRFEYIRVRNEMLRLSFTHGYSQDLSSATEKELPAFDGTGV